MHESRHFALLIVAVAGAGLLAVLSNRVTEKLRVPAAAVFLVVAAVAQHVITPLHAPPLHVVEDLVHRRAGGRPCSTAVCTSAGAGCARAAPTIATVGILGTFLTAGAAAVLLHVAFGLEWYAALLVGTAVAPTDPAVVFSVLGRREIVGESGTVLEGESGANDPVGIALMASLLSAGRLDGGAVGPRPPCSSWSRCSWGVRSAWPRAGCCSRSSGGSACPPTACTRCCCSPGIQLVYGATTLGARLGLPGGVRRGDRPRGRAGALQGRDRPVPRRAGEPRRDRRVRRARAHRRRRPDLPPRRVGARPRARPGPRARRSGPCSRASACSGRGWLRASGRSSCSSASRARSPSCWAVCCSPRRWRTAARYYAVIVVVVVVSVVGQGTLVPTRGEAAAHPDAAARPRAVDLRHPADQRAGHRPALRRHGRVCGRTAGPSDGSPTGLWVSFRGPRRRGWCRPTATWCSPRRRRGPGAARPRCRRRARRSSFAPQPGM